MDIDLPEEFEPIFVLDRELTGSLDQVRMVVMSMHYVDRPSNFGCSLGF